MVIFLYLKGMYVNGVIKWFKKDKVLLVLSYRYKFVDVYWFLFFYELGYILKYGRKEVFIEGDDEILKNELEEEVDNFAVNIFIFYKDYKKFIIENKFFIKDNIIVFVNFFNIYFCIVVGRLMYDKLISYLDFNELRLRINFKS